MRVRVGDRRLFCDVVGSQLTPQGPQMREKPTLIMLHGGPGHDHSLYRPWFDPLQDIAQVLYLDFRGHGRSDRVSREQWNLAAWAEDVVDLCDQLGIQRPVVFGHSVGGVVAMTYATRYPHHPGGLVLSATFARQRLDRVEKEFRKLGGETAARAAVAYFTQPSPEEMGAFTTHCLPLYARDMTDVEAGLRVRARLEISHHFFANEAPTLDLLEDLSRVRFPTLVLGGCEDPVCSIDDLRDIAAALPKDLVRYREFEACRHGLWADAGPPYFDVLRAFVSEVALSGSPRN